MTCYRWIAVVQLQLLFLLPAASEAFLMKGGGAGIHALRVSLIQILISGLICNFSVKYTAKIQNEVCFVSVQYRTHSNMDQFCNYDGDPIYGKMMETALGGYVGGRGMGRGRRQNK